MRSFSNLFYGIGQGIKNIFRNRLFSLASIATMSACLFLFCVFYSVLANFRALVFEAEENIGITVFFDEGISADRIEEIGVKIRQRPDVAKVTYTSGEQAWADYKAKNLNAELAASFGDDNPLENSASYTVYLTDVSSQENLAAYLERIDGVRKVNDAAEVARNLEGINSVISVISAVIIIVLLLVAIFLISITISTGVSVRKTEISIMKLIGATDHFIRTPFVVEGIIIGVVGALIPLLIVKYGYTGAIASLMEYIDTSFAGTSFLSVNSIRKVLVPVCLLMGVGIGYIGSTATLRKQLRKIEVNG